MANLLRKRNVVIAMLGLLLGLLVFLALQACFLLHLANADAVMSEYMGRGVFYESQLSRVKNFYPNGKERWTFKIPSFDENFRMHEASFRWNENRHIPPDSKTDLRDTWVGTCTLKPKSPWRQIDIFGVLGPTEIKLYGDWHIE